MEKLCPIIIEYSVPFKWERVVSSQVLFISVFYMDFSMDIQYECDNAFQNLKRAPEPFFFLEKSTENIYGSAIKPIYSFKKRVVLRGGTH